MLEAGKAGDKYTRGLCVRVPIAITREIVVFEVLGKVVSRATLVPAEGFDVKQNERWAVFETGLGAISARGLTRYLVKLTRIYCFC